MVRAFSLIAATFVLSVLLVGCSEPTKVAKNGADKKKEEKKDDHSAWWCKEHGIPEDDCSQCLPADVVKKRFKDTGDWCAKHERAQSQCFICDPTLYEKVFEPKYVAKYNKKPERPDEDEFKK